MKKPNYWTASFGLWLASLDLNRGKNTLHNRKKHFEESKFLSFDPNLKRNKKFKPNDVKRESFRSLETDRSVSLKNEPPDDDEVEVVLKIENVLSDTEKDSDRLQKNQGSDVQNEKLVSKYKVVLEDYASRLIGYSPYFSMEIDYVNLQSLKEIRYLIPEGKE
ncbi:hypothetical protein C922_01464 [Plasmodium inui San Antonio 1]|uniref:Uncharacterized protein n=1 Tax=Plasmodium inui San Antonio 1 TaxID=1237626 RepID=W7A3M5_9APIC|nr:hypothetical protein C922_01464 [Plasmodium inui San Antonio 1]EUD67852.1 hypothetical protein C922_01464 [Plasmodium inui San Antonio 1]